MTHYSTVSKIYNIKSDSKDAHLDISSKSTSIVSITTSTITIPTTTINTTAVVTNVTTATANSEDSNSLPGLLAHYNSDSEHEDEKDSDQLDARVDDFLQEINKLDSGHVKKDHTNQEKNKEIITWQECYDNTSGYPYYWNTENNQVTWEMPEEYKKWMTQNVAPKGNKQEQVGNRCPVHVRKVLNEEFEESKKSEEQPNITNRKKEKQLVDDDEKIILITSFSEGSSSSDSVESNKNDTTNNKEEDSIKKAVAVMGPHLESGIPRKQEILEAAPIPNEASKKEIIVENVKDENIDETVILSRLRTQAKVLQELGGELPKSVDRLLTEKSEVVEPSHAAGLSLVAGYGDDTDDDESPSKPAFAANEDINPEQKAPSALFPIMKPIDVKQFEVMNQGQSSALAKPTDDTSLADNKLFKRKKRLGVPLGIPLSKTEKKFKLDSNSDSIHFAFEHGVEERKGFGFQSEGTLEANGAEDKIEKVPFVKGGIAFVKADVLHAAEPEAVPPSEPTKPNDDANDVDGFEETREIVCEKVRFLSEGKEPVSAVQVMLIQLQTLEAAFKAGGLSQKYFWWWIRATFSELGQLEEDAAPAGWHCQWDRLNKRYFYRNQQTGETQWQYPDPDIVGGAEAMDICTTPPPPPIDEPDLLGCDKPEAPPASARAHSATPPPPPTALPPPPPPPPPPTPPPIASSGLEHMPHESIAATPIQADELETQMSSACASPVLIVAVESQPLPPGVDSADVSSMPAQSQESSNGPTNSANDALVSELDSFYSDIAMLEAATATATATAVAMVTTTSAEPIKNESLNVPSPSAAAISEGQSTDQVVYKKKKKSKTKIGQRLDMKKKAVSSLVEKWKKVQNDYL